MCTYIYIYTYIHTSDCFLPGDKLVGEASRIIVAEACIQALDIECTCGNTYEINSVEVSKCSDSILLYNTVNNIIERNVNVSTRVGNDI